MTNVQLRGAKQQRAAGKKALPKSPESTLCTLRATKTGQRQDPSFLCCSSMTGRCNGVGLPLLLQEISFPVIKVHFLHPAVPMFLLSRETDRRCQAGFEFFQKSRQRAEKYFVRHNGVENLLPKTRLSTSCHSRRYGFG